MQKYQLLFLFIMLKITQKNVDSIVNQTFNDLEIKCVNNGSKDNPLKILEKYAKKRQQNNLL